MADNNLKRKLNLATLDEIVQEANSLLTTGYMSNGNWNLSQTCFHLGEWLRYPMDGFPKPPFFLRTIFGVLKALGIVERMKTNVLEHGFKAGTPTAPATVLQPDAMQDSEAVENLADIVERMKKFEGPLHPSPLFGEMDRSLWYTVSLRHAEHHLAFLMPK